MRLVSVVFDEVDGRQAGAYGRMARALERSAAENSPAAPLTMLRPGAHEVQATADRWRRPHDPGRSSLVANTAKLEAWRDAVEAAGDGEVLGLLDCDLLVLGDLSEVELLDFDLAYTVRPAGAPYPFNGGVVFVRVSNVVREFMRSWVDLNNQLLVDAGAHAPLRKRYGGINQAAFGALIESAGLDLLRLPCETWNCEDSTWHRFDARTKVLHIKSQLRQACFGQRQLDPYNRPLVELWRRYAS